MRDVFLAYLHPDDVSQSFHRSIVDMMGYDAANNQRLGNWSSVKCGTSGVPQGRNDSAKAMLETGCDWMLFIDSDMGFEKDTLDRLLAVADPETRPMIGGLCFAYREFGATRTNGFRAKPMPTIFDPIEKDGVTKLTGRSHFPVNSLVRAGGTGGACLLIHRTVIAKIANEYGPVWFDRLRDQSGDLLGEDISFFVRCAALELPLHIHTGVRTCHSKTTYVDEEAFWLSFTAEPAELETDVIVPVIRRPQNAEPFMKTLRASTGLAHVTAVSHLGDEETAYAWRKAGADVLIQDPDRPTTFACKVNDGVAATGRDLVYVVGDDVRFRPGWLDHAQFMARKYDKSVVGTNDGTSPRVASGDHATHMLIVREYIDKYGASWDGPGSVCHEGYQHWFVDDEIVSLAAARNTFMVALGARVDHMHPLWGLGDDDDVYELGQSHKNNDQKLFKGRRKAYASAG